MTLPRLFCEVLLDGRRYRIEVGRVQEGLRAQVRTRVPLSPAGIAGLINLRGQVITEIRLRSRLGMPPAPDEEGGASVVVRTAEGPVSFLVDQVGEVIAAEASRFERPPETLRDAGRTLIAGAYKLDDGLLLALDLDRVLDAAGEVRSE